MADEKLRHTKNVLQLGFVKPHEGIFEEIKVFLESFHCSRHKQERSVGRLFYYDLLQQTLQHSTWRKADWKLDLILLPTAVKRRSICCEKRANTPSLDLACGEIKQNFSFLCGGENKLSAVWKKSFSCLSVYAIENYMKNFFIFSFLVVSFCWTYFIMLLCKGVLDINFRDFSGKQKSYAEIYLSISTVFLLTGTRESY